MRHAGSCGDAGLNAAIPRFKANPQAVARFAADVDHQGRFAVPVISVHAISDATVFVEGQDTLRQRMTAAGHAARHCPALPTAASGAWSAGSCLRVRAGVRAPAAGNAGIPPLNAVWPSVV
ncbi:MAG: hypothetical protein U1E02_38850 [Hydrogenophaga sp.]|nr:hypothetical protein [Hydrogenophaga sp.]